MATNTTNYGWTKPDYEDAADIMVINDTIDNIDAQVKTNENNILSVKNNVEYITDTINIMSDMSMYELGYFDAGGNYMSGPSHCTYMMSLGNINKIVISPATALANTLAFGVVKKSNGSIRQILACNGTSDTQTFNINGDNSDTLYMTQYQLSQPQTFYETYQAGFEHTTKEYDDCINKPITFTNKKLQFFGDSITVGYIAGGSPTSNNYPALFSSHVGASSHINNGVLGASLAPVDGYSCIYDTIQSNLDTTADVIFIAGGINDWQLGVTMSQLRKAVDNICSYLTQHYSGEVVFITPINHSGRVPINAPQQTVTSIRQIITEKALEYGYNIVQGSNFPFPNSASSPIYITKMFQDNLHPTELGYAMYAKSLAKAMM
jgi:lysophospholipase L1-like esterase